MPQHYGVTATLHASLWFLYPAPQESSKTCCPAEALHLRQGQCSDTQEKDGRQLPAYIGKWFSSPRNFFFMLFPYSLICFKIFFICSLFAFFGCCRGSVGLPGPAASCGRPELLRLPSRADRCLPLPAQASAPYSTRGSWRHAVSSLKDRNQHKAVLCRVWMQTNHFHGYTGWGKRRFTVVHTDNNTITNK